MNDPKETPDVTIARLVNHALSVNDDRVTALCLIEYLLNGADRLARGVMDADETNSFCIHLDAALSVLDDMD
ncbi:MAG: hypothetical protein MOB07_04845 [Acidobacteria bacterium]|nr:hypothetical protein [Acidobacteriota bacterium]